MYESTRNRQLNVHASYAIVSGIAPDGGLYVPKRFEPFDFRNLSSSTSYPELTKLVLNHFLDDFTPDDLDFVDQAYRDFTPVVGLNELENDVVLSLSHGPTFAFKDMALVLFSTLLAKAREKQNMDEKSVLITATSGDTGSATLNGFKDDPHTDVVVFYPLDGISAFQEQQMLSLTDSNHMAVALEGSFDDCQHLVKQAFSQLNQEGIRLSSANSINIARIIPQVVYYIYAYVNLVSRGRFCFGETIDVVVPTGNFGNILAAYYAKMIGLPIAMLTVASNENHVLTDFFKTGIYRAERPFKKTISPSMDILVSSNLERLIYLKTGRDDVLMRTLAEELTKNGVYALDAGHMRKLEDFHAGYASERETLQTIMDTFEKNGVLLDPHTAVAVSVYRRSVRNRLFQRPTVIVSTADPFKFSDAMCRAFGLHTGLNDPFLSMTALEKRTGIHAHERMKHIMSKHFDRTIWTKDEAVKRLQEWIGRTHDTY